MDIPQAPDLLAAVVAKGPDAVVVVDREGSIVLVNEQAAALFGYSQEEFLALAVDQLVPVASRSKHVALRQQFAETTASRPMAADLKLHALRRDATLVPVEISLANVDVGGARYTVAAVRDVTEKRRLEAEIDRISAQSQRTSAELALSEDRERIARDLHDKVIQRVFGVGLTLDGMLKRVDDPQLHQRLHRCVEQLDLTIKDIRTSIFDLENGPYASPLSDRLGELVGDYERLLGFRPSLQVVGPVDHAVPSDFAEELLSVAREALSNVARHSRATTVDLVVEAADELRLVVVDNGMGVGSGVAKGRGLVNMRERAERRGGSFSIGSARVAPPTVGTVLSWAVALPGASSGSAGASRSGSAAGSGDA